jgi:hypothetical protein
VASEEGHERWREDRPSLEHETARRVFRSIAGRLVLLENVVKLKKKLNVVKSACAPAQKQ